MILVRLESRAELRAQSSLAERIVASARLKIIFIALSSDVGLLCDLSRWYLHLTLTLAHYFRYLVALERQFLCTIYFFGAFAADTRNRQVSRAHDG